MQMYSMQNWIVGIYPSFKNTLAILKETGYPLTVEDLDIEKIVLNYFNDENGQQEDVTYENARRNKSSERGIDCKIQWIRRQRFRDISEYLCICVYR